MRMVHESLRVGKIHVRGSFLGIDNFQQGCAASLVRIETRFKNAVCIFEHAAAVQVKPLDTGLIAGIGIAHFRFNPQLHRTELKFRLSASRSSGFHFSLIAEAGNRQVNGKAEAQDIVNRLEEVAGSNSGVREGAAEAHIGNQIDACQFNAQVGGFQSTGLGNHIRALLKCGCYQVVDVERALRYGQFSCGHGQLRGQFLGLTELFARAPSPRSQHRPGP